MMRMIAGKRCYGVNVGGEMEVAVKFEEIVDETVRLGGSGNILDFLPWLKWMGFGGAEKRLMVLQEKRKRFMQMLVEEHKRRMGIYRDTETNKTTIEIMLSLQESDPEFYADETIGALMLVLLAAGADTKMETMEWAMALLLNNLDILKEAQIEIDNQIGCDHLIDEFELVKLPYLRCIIFETFRLYPPGPLLVPHESSEECVVGGFCVPHGTMLLVNAWAIQNDKRIWEDSKKFKPERFEGIEIHAISIGKEELSR